MADENPILNNPYEEPRLHYVTNLEGELDYSKVEKGRRVFAGSVQTIPLPQRARQEELMNEAYQNGLRFRESFKIALIRCQTISQNVHRCQRRSRLCVSRWKTALTKVRRTKCGFDSRCPLILLLKMSFDRC